MTPLPWIKWMLVAIVIAFAAPTSAAEKNLADVWVVKPNPGQWQSFETAFKRHIEYRQQQNDPRKWYVYQPTIGLDLDYYVIRSCCFSWAELDSYREWGKQAKTGDHWSKHVDQYVAHVAHHIAEIDMENSNWPEGDPGFNYFEVVSYYPRPGHGNDINADKKRISDAAKKMNWPESWSWGWIVGGKPQLDLVFGYKDYADMEPVKPSFAEQLGKHMKSDEKAKELLKGWGQHFRGTQTTIYVLNDEMSMK